MSDIKIKSIPTFYAGVRFRSRLEARWAALFDELAWSWTYEPYDLDGWAPDFAIRGKRGDILVEVKPVPGAVMSDEFYKARSHPAVLSRDVLLLGHSPVKIDRRDFIGLCNEPGSETYDFSKAVIGLWEGAETFGYCDEIRTFEDRISGLYDGGSWGGLKPKDLMPLWANATNAIQWISRQ